MLEVLFTSHVGILTEDAQRCYQKVFQAVKFIDLVKGFECTSVPEDVNCYLHRSTADTDNSYRLTFTSCCLKPCSMTAIETFMSREKLLITMLKYTKCSVTIDTNDLNFAAASTSINSKSTNHNKKYHKKVNIRSHNNYCTQK